MEKRDIERRKTDLQCELVSRSLNFSGLIKNLSEHGICVMINPTRAVEDIPQGMPFVVKIHTPPENIIDIQCRVKQAYKTSPDGPTDNVGMEIIDRSPEYTEFIKSMKHISACEE